MAHSRHSTTVGAAHNVIRASPLSGPPPRAAHQPILAYVGYKDSWRELRINDSRILGKGEFGTVCVAKMAGTSARDVAVKIIDKPEDKPDSIALMLLDREVARWKNLNHRRILPFYGRSEPFQLRKIALVTALAPNGNMLEFITKYPNEGRLRLVQQVAEGMQYLHQVAKIVHGDLKCSNVVIDAHFDALIADFGLSTALEGGEGPTKTLIRQINSLAFAAPELLTDKAYARSESSTPNPKRSKTEWSDSFAFGRLIYEAYAGASAWRGHHPTKIRHWVENSVIPPRQVETNVVAGRNKINVARPIGNALWALCVKCWDRNPFSRPRCEEILQIVTSELRKGQR